MLENQKCHATIDLVIIFKVTDLVILIQTLLEILTQLIVRLVTDSEYIHSILLEFPTKLPVVCREIR